jgi:hypothetical protein
MKRERIYLCTGCDNECKIVTSVDVDFETKDEKKPFNCPFGKTFRVDWHIHYEQPGTIRHLEEIRHALLELENIKDLLENYIVVIQHNYLNKQDEGCPVCNSEGDEIIHDIYACEKHKTIWYRY